jgi:hypothetical protein
MHFFEIHSRSASSRDLEAVIGIEIAEETRQLGLAIEARLVEGRVAGRELRGIFDALVLVIVEQVRNLRHVVDADQPAVLVVPRVRSRMRENAHLVAAIIALLAGIDANQPIRRLQSLVELLLPLLAAFDPLRIEEALDARADVLDLAVKRLGDLLVSAMVAEEDIDDAGLGAASSGNRAPRAAVRAPGRYPLVASDGTSDLSGRPLGCTPLGPR